MVVLQTADAYDIVLAGAKTLTESGVSGKVMGSAVILAGILAMFNYYRISRSFVQHGELDFWDFVKPLVILVVVAHFNTFVVRPMFGLCGLFSAPLQELAGSELARSNHDGFDIITATAKNGGHLVTESATDFIEEITALKNQDLPWYKKTYEFLKIFISDYYGYRFKNLLNNASGGIALVLEYLAKLLFKLMALAYQIYAGVFLTILILVGPLTFAVSEFPAFSGGIKLWFERFIEMMLWIPILNLIMGVSSFFSNSMYTVFCDGNGYNLSGVWMSIALTLVSTFCILQTSAIASWVVETAGASGLIGNVSQSITGVASKVGKFGGALRFIKR